MKDLHVENYKTLIKETEDDSKKWKDSMFLEELVFFKMAILPREICRYHALSIKICMTFFTGLEYIIQKFI